MFCQVCGTISPEGSKVCTKCAHAFGNPIPEGQTLTQMSTRLGPPVVMKQGLTGPNRMTRILIYLGFAAVVIVVPTYFLMSQMTSNPGALTGGGESEPTAIPLDTEEFSPGVDGELVLPQTPSEAIASQGDVSRINNLKRLQTAIEFHAAEFGPYPETLEEIAEQLDFPADPSIYEYTLGDEDYVYAIKVRLKGSGLGLTPQEILHEDGVNKYVIYGY